MHVTIKYDKIFIFIMSFISLLKYILGKMCAYITRCTVIFLNILIWNGACFNNYSLSVLFSGTPKYLPHLSSFPERSSVCTMLPLSLYGHTVGWLCDTDWKRFFKACLEEARIIVSLFYLRPVLHLRVRNFIT